MIQSPPQSALIQIILLLTTQREENVKKRERVTQQTQAISVRYCEFDSLCHI